MDMPFLVSGRFIRRDNRFRATVDVGGHQTWAHVPNSGRLGELLTPGRPVWLAPAAGALRKTAFDLKLVEYDSILVSVDARLPNPLFAEALAAERLKEFDYPHVAREVSHGASRLDFRLTGPRGVCWTETKSVTLVENGVAMFPDAPTSRGRKHLFSLLDIFHSGERAAVVFVIQRPDAQSFRPHSVADPEFSAALIQVAEVGVEVRAYTCRVTLTHIDLDKEIPVYLSKR
jgi:sugar fermentation stimulation protein A